MTKEVESKLKNGEFHEDLCDFLPQTILEKEVIEKFDPFEENKDYFIKKTTFKAIRYVAK
jgi:hypothetical protein